jgi:hypothetical protein
VLLLLLLVVSRQMMPSMSMGSAETEDLRRETIYCKFNIILDEEIKSFRDFLKKEEKIMNILKQ